jgi:CHASE1-domain containing sensor protein
MSKSTAIVLSLVLGLLALVLFIVFAIRLANQSGQNKLGDQVFEANAQTISRNIDDDGPVLLQDLSGGSRDVYVQHLSDDLRKGWRAFRATAPGAERRCTLRWDGAARVFRDEACGTGATFPADGTGLEQFAAYVEGRNKLVVDLRRAGPVPDDAPAG